MTDVTNVINSMSKDLGENCTYSITSSSEGGAQARTLYLGTTVLGGTAGYRAGSLSIYMERDEGQEFEAAWDGNPDCGLKATVVNYGNNLDGVTPIGGLRVLDVQARNRGDNLGWVKAVEINAKNDTGAHTIGSMTVVHIRAEQMGTSTGDVVGIDLEMANEGTASAEVIGMIVRNNDLSGVHVVDHAFEVSHAGASTGFTNLFHFDTDSVHDTIGTGTVGTQNRAIKVLVNATPYYIPLYTTLTP